MYKMKVLYILRFGQYSSCFPRPCIFYNIMVVSCQTILFSYLWLLYQFILTVMAGLEGRSYCGPCGSVPLIPKACHASREQYCVRFFLYKSSV